MVAPYGKGLHADFTFRLSRISSETGTLRELVLDLVAPGDSNGFSELIFPAYTGSDLRFPRAAPETGYVTSLQRRQVLYGEGAQQGKFYDPNRHYFFRVRSTVQNGKLVSAQYGKIARDIEFFSTDEIRFVYYLNSTPNDRNMEFDPQQNLFGNLPPLERVPEP